MSKDSILEEIYKLESRLNKYNQSQIGVSFEDLDKQQFDLNTYIQINFTNGRSENVSINFDKILKTLPYYNDIHKNTCEEIVVSIDQNFEKYLEISTKFEALRQKLASTQHFFDNFNKVIQNYFIHNTQDLNKLKNVLESYVKVIQYEQSYEQIKEIVSILQDITNLQKNNLNKSNPFYFEDFQKCCILISAAQKKFTKLNKSKSLGKELESRFELKDYLDSLRKDLVNRLEAEFTSFLKNVSNSDFNWKDSGNLKALQSFLENYAYLQSRDAAEKVLEKILFNPFIQELIDKLNEEKIHSIVATKQEYNKLSSSIKFPVRNFYYKVLALMDHNFFQALEEVTMKNSNHLSPYFVDGYNIVLSFWKSIFTFLISKELSFIHSVGIADNFNANYKATISFLNNLSRRHPDSEDKKKFWGDETIKKFLSKWSMSTYYPLRYTEIVKELEKSFRDEKLMVYSSDSSSVKVEKSIKSFIENCFATRIFNIHISAKFLKLSYQIAIYYSQRIKEFYKRTYLKKEFTDMSLNTLVNFINELENLTQYFKSSYLDQVNEAFKQDVILMEYNDLVIPLEKNKEFSHGINSTLNDTLYLFEDELAKYIYSLCEKQLEPFNTIPSKFRMTGKGMPTNPSNFISNIFVPLDQFWEKKNIQNTSKERIQILIFKKIYARFIEIAEEIIKSNQRSEELLNKYKSGDGNQSQNQQSDFRKIKYQFYLDNIELAKSLKSAYDFVPEGYSEKLFME